MARLIRHIKRWNIWRKHNANGRLHHLLVFFNIIKSPTFGLVLLPEELTSWSNAIKAVTSSPEEVYNDKTRNT